MALQLRALPTRQSFFVWLLRKRLGALSGHGGRTGLALRVFAKLAIFTRKREGKETPSIEGLEFITKYVNDG
jgi:hypothetical protein